MNKGRTGGKRHVVEMVSAGGVVCRNGNGRMEVVLCGRKDPLVWALPKGTPDTGETREQTALREVSEETGLEVATAGVIDAITYWFVRSADGARCQKTVFYYLMEATGGDTSRHDHEFDEVEWFPADEALRTLTYANEVKIVKKGLSLASGQVRA